VWRRRSDEQELHVDIEHVDQQSRSSSRSFVCPDCGIGVESITALTVHLLTHAELNADNESVAATSSQPQRGGSSHGGCDAEAINSRPPSTCSDDVDNTGDYDDDDVMNVDDCQVSVNQPPHHCVTDDLDTSTQGHSEGEADEKAQCFKVTSGQTATEDALEGVVRLECPYCQRKDFDSVGPLTSHIRTTHARPSDNLFTCGSCGLAFATVDKLQQHQRAQHDTPSGTPAISAASSLSGQGTPPVDGLTEPRWMCRFCPVQFYDAQTLRDHEEAIHLSRTSLSNIVTQSSVVFCSQCSLGFPHIYALADHMHHSHGYNTRARVVSHDAPAATGADTAAPSGRCRDPVRPTAVRADSVDIARRALSTGKVTATSKVTASAVCAECSTTFDNDDELEAHVASAHYLSLGTEYGCTSCLKLFARPEDLQKHLLDVHAHHLYRCTLCKQVFDSKVCLYSSARVLISRDNALLCTFSKLLVCESTL